MSTKPPQPSQPAVTTNQIPATNNPPESAPDGLSTLDSLLTESNDLLNASRASLSLSDPEAALTYSRLAHTLLLKLGRWFDTSYIVPTSDDARNTEEALEEERKKKLEEENTKRTRAMIMADEVAETTGGDDKELKEFLNQQAMLFLKRKREEREEKERRENEIREADEWAADEGEETPNAAGESLGSPSKRKRGEGDVTL